MKKNSKDIKRGYSQKHKQKISCEGKENTLNREEDQ